MACCQLLKDKLLPELSDIIYDYIECDKTYWKERFIACIRVIEGLGIASLFNGEPKFRGISIKNMLEHKEASNRSDFYFSNIDLNISDYEITRDDINSNWIHIHFPTKYPGVFVKWSRKS